MGDRAQVHVYGWEGDTDVYLYTHYGARDLPQTVRDALRRIDSPIRLENPSYLARMIFSEMVRDDIDGSTGFGIDNIQHGDVWRVITVDTDEGIVSFEGYNAQTYSITDYIDTTFALNIATIEA